MKMKTLQVMLSLFVLTFFLSCSDDDDDNKDKTSIVEATVAAETEEVVIGQQVIQEFLKVKFDGDANWSRVHLGEISGFHFDDGNEYRLKIKKTELANPPADGSSVTYELSETISKTSKNPNIQMVQRFYIGDIYIAMSGDQLTAAEKKEIETKVLADFPKPFYRTFKFIFTDKESPVGDVVVYTNTEKETGTFERSIVEGWDGTAYTTQIKGEERMFVILKSLKSIGGGGTGLTYGFTEELTEKYKADYPNLKQLLVQHLISDSY